MSTDNMFSCRIWKNSHSFQLKKVPYLEVYISNLFGGMLKECMQCGIGYRA